MELSSKNGTIGYTDNSGNFEFPLHQYNNDTLYFHHPDYTTYMYFGEVASLKELYLEKRTIHLSEVLVQPLSNRYLIDNTRKKSNRFSFNYGMYYVNLLKAEHELFAIHSIEYTIVGQLNGRNAIELSFYEYQEDGPGLPLENYRQIISSDIIQKGKLRFELTKPLIVRGKYIYIGIKLIDQLGAPMAKTKPSGLSFKYIDLPNTPWWIKSTNAGRDSIWIQWHRKNAFINMQPLWKIAIRY